LLTNEKLTIFYSRELLFEFETVISRKKFEKYIRKDQVNRFMNLVMSKLKLVTIKTFVRLSRDLDDNYLLSMSLDCDADYLITGDPDLLLLHQFGKTKVVNMSEFLKVIE